MSRLSSLSGNVLDELCRQMIRETEEFLSQHLHDTESLPKIDYTAHTTLPWTRVPSKTSAEAWSPVGDSARYAATSPTD